MVDDGKQMMRFERTKDLDQFLTGLQERHSIYAFAGDDDLRVRTLHTIKISRG